MGPDECKLDRLELFLFLFLFFLDRAATDVLIVFVPLIGVSSASGTKAPPMGSSSREFRSREDV